MQEQRRPIFFRALAPTRWVAKLLARIGLTPNQISIWSVFCSLIAGVCIVRAYHGWTDGYGLAAFFVLMRLLCNMFDGLVAVEHGKATRDGAFFNELPDRVSDIVIIMALSVAIDLRELGLWASLFAVLTAYVRTLATQVGAPADFSGPMAKQQRMFVVIIACLVSLALPAFVDLTFLTALFVIAAGSAVTCISRTFAALRALND